MIVALIPAGGQSRRMGQPKLLLPLGGQTVLERVIHTLHQSGIKNTLVVTTRRIPRLAEVATTAGAGVVTLPADTPDMRATVDFGLTWIAQNWSPAPSDAWLLVPADHPTLEVSVIQQLLAAAGANQGHSIFVPTHGGNRGHPTLVRWEHVAVIRSFPPDRGLNEYFRANAAQMLEVPVESPKILCDLDTAEDYERLLQEFG